MEADPYGMAAAGLSQQPIYGDRHCLTVVSMLWKQRSQKEMPCLPQ